jgi:hypothetical protein
MNQRKSSWRCVSRNGVLHDYFGHAIRSLDRARKALVRHGGNDYEVEDTVKVLKELRALRNKRNHNREVVTQIMTFSKVTGAVLGWHQALYRVMHEGMCPGIPLTVRELYGEALRDLLVVNSLGKLLYEERIIP